MNKAEKRLIKDICGREVFGTAIVRTSDVKQVLNMLEKAREYSKGNIECCENRIKDFDVLNSPFCNLEKVSKELMIHKNYLEILGDKGE